MEFTMIRLVTLLSCGIGLAGCATASGPVDMQSYSRADISIILSAKFDGSESDAARALKPSYDKFGAPQRYVSGNMSAVYESEGKRLYGAGDIYARLSLSHPVFWQIEGKDLAADVDPIKTVHLLYDKEDLRQAAFGHIETEIRRGQSYTVFERDLGSRLVVSIYPTTRLSENADLKMITFQN